MSRLARVILYSLIILILYYVIHEIIRVYYKASTPAVSEQNEEDTSTVDSQYSDTLMVDSLLSDELITNEAIVGGGSVDAISGTNASEQGATKRTQSLPEPAPKNAEVPSKAKPAVADKPVQKTSAPTRSVAKEQTKQAEPAPSRPAVKPEPKQAPVKQQPASVVRQPGDGGKYLVMAGSYLLRDNATKMVKKLREMGYTNAEVIIFPESEFHSVIAVRYDSEAKAQSAVTELKRKGIESFFKVK